MCNSKDPAAARYIYYLRTRIRFQIFCTIMIYVANKPRPIIMKRKSCTMIENRNKFDNIIARSYGNTILNDLHNVHNILIE